VNGFVAAPGTDWTRGDTREIAARLDKLAKQLGVEIVGISGYRTPSHSVAVGGFANDPHTKGQAGDIGVNSALRASAATLTDKQLASVGLYRPFPGAQEINHVQLMPGAKQQINAATVKPSPSASPTPGSGNNNLIDKIASAAVGEVAPAAGVDPAGAVTDAAGGAVQKAAQAAIDATLGKAWAGLKGKAEYAGLFAVIVFAGAALAILGLLRATGTDRKLKDAADQAVQTGKQAAEIAAL
jgi:hypothetical protein